MVKQEALPLPNPGEWMTRRAAADELACSVRSVERMVVDGVLHSYQPQAGRREQRVPMILWAPEVKELARARRRVAGDRS
jgi:hypothetical protein